MHIVSRTRTYAIQRSLKEDELTKGSEAIGRQGQGLHHPRLRRLRRSSCVGPRSGERTTRCSHQGSSEGNCGLLWLLHLLQGRRSNQASDEDAPRHTVPPTCARYATQSIRGPAPRILLRQTVHFPGSQASQRPTRDLRKHHCVVLYADVQLHLPLPQVLPCPDIADWTSGQEMSQRGQQHVCELRAAGAVLTHYQKYGLMHELMHFYLGRSSLNAGTKP